MDDCKKDFKTRKTEYIELHNEAMQKAAAGLVLVARRHGTLSRKSIAKVSKNGKFARFFSEVRHSCENMREDLRSIKALRSLVDRARRALRDVKEILYDEKAVNEIDEVMCDLEEYKKYRQHCPFQPDIDPRRYRHFHEGFRREGGAYQESGGSRENNKKRKRMGKSSGAK